VTSSCFEVPSALAIRSKESWERELSSSLACLTDVPGPLLHGLGQVVASHPAVVLGAEGRRLPLGLAPRFPLTSGYRSSLAGGKLLGFSDTRFSSASLLLVELLVAAAATASSHHADMAKL